MPILFVIGGLFSILYLFNFNNFQKYYFANILYFVSVFVLLGFFSKNYFCGVYSFNFFYLVAYVILLMFSVFKSRVSLSFIVLLVLISIVYYMLLNNNLLFMLDYEFGNYVGGVLLILSLLFFKFYNGMFFLLISFFSVILLSGYFGYLNYNVFYLDILYGLQMVMTYLLISLINFILIKSANCGVKNESKKKSFYFDTIDYALFSYSK